MNSFAETFGYINSVKNENSFLVAQDETASILKKGDFLEAGSQILVEEGGFIIFSDYYDNRYQLGSGGLIKIKENGMELNRGVLKIKSLGLDGKTITVETPNSVIKFSESEGSISYLPELSKTEVFSFEGLFELISKNKLNSSVDVREGQYSQITSGIQMGMASLPSSFSQDQLDKISSGFSKVPTRKISSIKDGKIIFIPSKRSKPLKSRKRKPASVEKNEVPIKVYRSKIQTNNLDKLIKDLKSN